jgi:hypothetical protein
VLELRYMFNPEQQAYLGEVPLGLEGFLAESLAYGLLQACGVEGPPVPVRTMIRAPHPVFERLSLLELNLGLYDAAYRSLLNGSRLIAVDLDQPPAVRRAAMARELYVAFCRSQRAGELDWPGREHPRAYSDFFARCLLMPAAWVKQIRERSRSIEEMAAIFGVSTQMMADRLRELGIEQLR